MNILDIIKTRRSVREFKDLEIPESAIEALIEALRWAPSAGNLQGRKFYFVFNEAVRNKLAQAGLRHYYVSFISRSPFPYKYAMFHAESVSPYIYNLRVLP